MLETLRRAGVVPAVPIEGLVAVGTALAFVWLLVHGYVRPVAIYLLEIYLSF